MAGVAADHREGFARARALATRSDQVTVTVARITARRERDDNGKERPEQTRALLTPQKG